MIGGDISFSNFLSVLYKRLKNSKLLSSITLIIPVVQWPSFEKLSFEQSSSYPESAKNIGADTISQIAELLLEIVETSD